VLKQAAQDLWAFAISEREKDSRSERKLGLWNCAQYIVIEWLVKITAAQLTLLLLAQLAPGCATSAYRRLMFGESVLRRSPDNCAVPDEAIDCIFDSRLHASQNNKVGVRWDSAILYYSVPVLTLDLLRQLMQTSLLAHLLRTASQRWLTGNDI
jgi:hypothetical protein